MNVSIKKIIYCGVAILIIGLIIIMYLSKSNQTSSISYDELINSNPDSITAMIIISEGKSIKINDSSEFQRFIQVLKTCDSPIEPRKMRVLKEYEAYIKLGEKKVKLHFNKRNQMPFMLITTSNNNFQYYKCSKMESYLNSLNLRAN